MKHLEPVVKQNNASFSILLLRNDSNVVRFRLNSFWVKFLVFFFVCFSGVSGAAGYAAHYYWKKYNYLRLERSELAEKLGENRRQLNEFASIEKIKERQPRSSMVGVGTLGAENGAAGGGTPPTAAVSPVIPGDGSVPAPPADPSAQSGGAAPTAPADPAVPGEVQATTPQGNEIASAPAPDTPAEPGTGQTEPSPALSGKDAEHPAFIDKVQVRSAGGRAYRLTYELVNRERERDPGREQYLTLSGKVIVAVAARDATRHEITTISGDSLRFIIKWGKRVEVSFALPAELPPQDADKLLLTVEGDNFPGITYAFPLPPPQGAQEAPAQ